MYKSYISLVKFISKHLWFFFSNCKLLLLIKFMCICVCPHEFWCAVGGRGIRSPGVGVIGGVIGLLGLEF